MIEIIPAIDIIDGKCVRLSQGDYGRQTTYNENPLEVAKMFESYGVKRLHLVDLDGAKAKHIVNYKTLEQIASHTDLIIDFGGGLKSDEDAYVAFESGAHMITGGSIAVKDPETFHNWIKKYGADKIILGADIKEGMIAVSGWLEDTDEEINHFIQKYLDKNVNKVISTDISRDGMLTGPSYELYQDLLSNFPDLYVIASGGVADISDIKKLNELSVPAVITGKAIYEGRIDMEALSKTFLQ